MSVNTESKFYTFNQNNSGGSFIIDKKNGIGEYVIIEAFSVDDAVERAERIGLYFDGVYKGYDCECCGDRWYVPYGGGNDEPLIYSKSPEELQSEKWYSVKNIIIHYINGIVKCYAGKLD